jgi:uncharacterized membrane protein YdjX (TVP38/TMEM64 family)
MRRYARLLVVLAVLAALWALAHFSGIKANLTPQFVRESFASHPLVDLLIFVVLFSVGNLIQIPGWVFLTAAVATLGGFWGGVSTYVAAIVSCAITFVLLRLVGGDALRTFKGRLAQRLFARLDAHPVQSVGILRLLFQTAPALNYALALSGIRFRNYMIGTLLGLPLPITLYCVFLDALAHWLNWPLP